jgi:flagellar protein FlgJ
MNILPNNNITNVGKDPSAIKQRAENLKANSEDKELMDVCKEFESIFTYMMLKEMKKSIPDDGFIEKSQGTRVFEEMYLEELSKEMSSEDNGIGIAKMIYEQFKKRNIEL